MTRDWGSRDNDFIDLTARVRRRLLDLANANAGFSCIPLQGSGTFAVEAMIGSLVPPDGKLLVTVNGAYGRRMVKIGNILKRRTVSLESPEDEALDPRRLDDELAADATISHVATVHCETTSGVLNPVEEIAAVTARRGRRLLIDSMSAFGALPLDTTTAKCLAIAASANKCLEGVPGLSFVLVDHMALGQTAGNAPSLSLDLHDQWRGFEANGQWRFTPPTQVLAALDAALDQLDAEGGAAARLRRYVDNCRILVDGMRSLGFETLLDDAVQAPIIVTFRMPEQDGFSFGRFYDALHERGIVIYPGKVTNVESFRIGCIGAIDASDIRRALDAVADVLEDMNISL